MNFNAFVGGIEPGGLTNDFEVKILICFLLKKIEQPLSFDQVNEILQKTGFVNYFEFVEAVSELQKTEHVLLTTDENGQEVFQLSEIGEAMAQTFHHTLPLTVREKTVESARELIQMQKQLEETEVRYHAVDDGYILTMKLKDIGSDLMDLSVFVPSEDECVEIRERIYADPLLLYKTLLAVMMGDYQEGKQLFEEKLK
ncbi:MAG: DUF4364 family protein [Ruminococcaceae bacterium]|nr:DUF4364 family protein [Oscillospiraceae bacterium]MBQ9969546.1 DUF4364 family protein [Oscillospiraceae bacterium]